MLLSLCLFACAPKDPGGDNPNPDNPGDPGDPGDPDTGTAIASAQFYGDSTVVLKDAEAADATSGAAALATAAADVQVRVFFAGGGAPQQIGLDACTVDTSSVSWGTVGVYYATVTPNTQGAVNNDQKVTVNTPLTIRIEHAFGEAVNGVETCSHDGATRTTVTGSETLNYGMFHDGPSANSGDLAQIAPFGTVTQGGSRETEVLSMTAGRIRRGMSVTVTGTAQSVPPSGDTKQWYFPNIGVALREFDAKMSPIYATASSTMYDGGMSVIVRNDSFVLMNGIGDNGPDANYGTRLLAGLVGGATESYNYGSHDSTPSADYEGKVPASWNYDPQNIPTDLSQWGDWAVYSTGDIMRTGTYSEQKEIRLTWTFRQDNVIEMIYENVTDGLQLTAYMKVPDDYANMQFDTILHGDYVNMTFSSVSTVELEKLTGVRFNGLGSDAQKYYAANEAFNFDDLTGTVEVTYAQSEEWTAYNDFELQVFRGTLGADETAPAENAEGWVTLDDDTPLLATDTFFRIAVTVGNTTEYATVDKGDTGFITGIVKNNVTDVYGFSFGFPVGDETYTADSTALGDVGFTANADGTQIVIAPVGTASMIPAALAGTAPFSNFTGYLALRIWGTGLEDATLGEQTNIAIVAVGENGTYLDVLVGISAVNSATITGAQDTPIVIDLSGVTAPTWAWSVDYGEGLTSVPVNKGASVDVILTVSDAIYQTAMIAEDDYMMSGYSPTLQSVVAAGSGTIDNWDDGNGIRYSAAEADTDSVDGMTIVTITLEIPAALGDVGGSVPIYFNSGSDLVATQIDIYYGAPAVSASDNGETIELANGYVMYLVADGANVYYYIARTDDKVTSGDIATGSLWLNVNAGYTEGEDVVVPSFVDIGFTYANGAIVLNDATLAEDGILTTTLNVYGTVDNDSDYDRGFFFAGCIDTTKYGIASDAETYYFQLVQDLQADAQKGIYKVTVGETTTLAQQPDGTDEPTVLVEATCTQNGLRGNAIRDDENNIVFIYNATLILGEHLYTVDEDYEGIDGYTYSEGVCTRCNDVSGWKVEGVQVGKTDNSVTYTATHAANAAYNPGVGEKYSVIYSGQTVVASGVATSSGAGVWNGFTALLYKADIFFSNTNLRIDNYMNRFSGQSGTIDEYGLAFSSEVTSTVTIDQAQDAMSEDGGAPAAIVWDWSDPSEIVVTMTVTTVYGDYECVYTFTPAAGNEFEEDWYSIGIAPDAGSFTGTITASGSEATNFNMAKEHRDLDIDYNEDDDFIIGTEGNGTGWTPKQYTFPIDKNEKIVVSGPMTSASTTGEEGVGQWSAPVVGIYSGASAVGYMRSDNYIVDNNYASIGISVTQNPSMTNWTQVSAILASCTATYTIDFSNESKIVVTMQYVSEEEGTYTMTYTLTPVSGQTLADRYSIDFGCDRCYAEFTFNRTKHTHEFDSETDRCACGALNPEHEHSYVTDTASEDYDTCACGEVNPQHGKQGGTAHVYVDNYCKVCGELDPDHEHVDEDENGKCDLCDETMAGHTHDYTTGTKPGYCSCGDKDPNHGNTEAGGTAHVDEDSDAHCDVDYCGILMPGHEHSYSTTHGATYGYCICGDFDPNHGTDAEGATPHIDDDNNAWCDACGELMPTHEHSFTEGVCSCGAREFSTTVDGVVYTGIILPVEMTNNDPNGTWWNGSTNDITVKGDSVTVITWENTRDKNYFDYAVELVFNLGGKVGDTADGQFIDFDPTNQWTAEWVSATAPTVSGSTTGTQEAAGAENAGYGTYVATIVRIGTTITVTVEFTANGSDTVTWTRTGTATNCPTGDMVIRIAGNPFFLDDFAGWTGEIAATPAMLNEGKSIEDGTEE